MSYDVRIGEPLKPEERPTPEATQAILETYGHLQAEIATRVLQTLDDAGIPQWRYTEWLDEFDVFEGTTISDLVDLAREYKDAPPPEPVDDDEAKKIARLARELIGETPCSSGNSRQ